jgi:hypothetical protein
VKSATPLPCSSAPRCAQSPSAPFARWKGGGGRASSGGEGLLNCVVERTQVYRQTTIDKQNRGDTQRAFTDDSSARRVWNRTRGRSDSRAGLWRSGACARMSDWSPDHTGVPSIERVLVATPNPGVRIGHTDHTGCRQLVVWLSLQSRASALDEWPIRAPWCTPCRCR